MARTIAGMTTSIAVSPRWTIRLAHLLPLLALPVCLWRLPFTAGFTMGMSMEPMDVGLWAGIAYIGGLSVVSELCLLACMALVLPWGEVIPAWVPVVGGKPMPRYLVVVPATLGGLFLTALLVDWLLVHFQVAGLSGPDFENGWWELLAAVTSGMFVLCGPIVLLLTYLYWRRRGRTGQGTRSSWSGSRLAA